MRRDPSHDEDAKSEVVARYDRDVMPSVGGEGRGFGMGSGCAMVVESLFVMMYSRDFRGLVP